MTDIATASTSATDADAGRDLVRQIREQLRGEKPDAVIVFASPSNDYRALLTELNAGATPKALIGCSSAGEFTDDASGTGMSTAIAFRSSEMRFNASVGRGISRNVENAASDVLKNFRGRTTDTYRYRTAILLVDALAGHTEDLVDRLTVETAGAYRFMGGGAGDDGLFKKTHVFFGTEAYSDAAVALEILSNKPIGIGARHGWEPASEPLRVTESLESSIVSLNVSPAVEAFEDHAAATKQHFDRENPMPFFLHNIVGVKTDDGHKLRVPLGVGAEGGVALAAEVPAGATACIMGIGASDAADAAASATRDAIAQVRRSGNTPKAALFFDCVATRLRLGKDFGIELDAVKDELRGTPFVGFNSHGQIVRAKGQFSGFHNCTAVVAVFPE